MQAGKYVSVASATFWSRRIARKTASEIQNKRNTEWPQEAKEHRDHAADCERVYASVAARHERRIAKSRVDGSDRNQPAGGQRLGHILQYLQEHSGESPE